MPKKHLTIRFEIETDMGDDAEYVDRLRVIGVTTTAMPVETIRGVVDYLQLTDDGHYDTITAIEDAIRVHAENIPSS